MKLSVERQGELYISGGVLLWGFFPIIAFLSFHTLSPFISLAVSSLFSALFFAIILTVRRRWREVFNRQALPSVLWATGINGVLYFLLYYMGVRYTSPGNVSLLALTEIFFSFLLFHVWHKEYIPKEHIFGSLLILAGALIVLAPTIRAFHPGNLFILLGAAIVPYGNLHARKARKIVSTESLMFTRGLVSAVVIYMLAIVFQATNPLADIVSSLPYLVANGVLLLGLSTMFWIEGIHRITVTKANAMNSVGPLLTLFLAWGLLKTAPSMWQLFSFIPMFAGVLLLGKNLKKPTQHR